MHEKFIASLPAIGAILGGAIYYPYLWISVDYHEDVPYIRESYETELLNIAEFSKDHEVIEDIFGAKHIVPDCVLEAPYSIPIPKLNDGKLMKNENFVYASGRGEPIIRITGERPIFSKSYELLCHAKVSPIMTVNPASLAPEPIAGSIGKVESELELKEVDDSVVGHITEREVVFEKPFDISGFIQFFSMAGAWISLMYLFRHALTNNSTRPPKSAGE